MPRLLNNNLQNLEEFLNHVGARASLLQYADGQLLSGKHAEEGLDNLLGESHAHLHTQRLKQREKETEHFVSYIWLLDEEWKQGQRHLYRLLQAVVTDLT